VRIEIDSAKCAGHARCNAVASALFPLDDDGYVALSEFEVPPGREDDAELGADSCPECAITVVR
jgi:ferredoxin